ncbi:phosphonoacetaldehyde phosphonohydrolase-related protein [Pseudomonas sp. MAFF212427]|uniref:Phosphonoacetaldehyde phosphonohydrolase-related protein n=1 Tax=Pseudomonas brassicae TaxID=2708063 RepID=A0A6B3P2Y5_9PSED|nr:phosphonoacetaldehyde phosphonohydrolase-related protein [Pseudomonas brassicae]NER66698.1 phosphonoacetaldehyde phosphonohydrolase-related protein [Pseudomonas brassicae]
MPHSPAFTAVLFGLRGCLVDFGARCQATSSEPVHPTPGALQALHWLQEQGVPCAWLDEAPAALARYLSQALPPELAAPTAGHHAPWPAPDACWQALMHLNIAQLDGCVLVSGEPRLLQAGLNAGLWTVGLAACGSLCGMSVAQWQTLGEREREHKRTKATLQLFSLGVHSVIDQLEQLADCLGDIAQRRLKGEKP